MGKNIIEDGEGKSWVQNGGIPEFLNDQGTREEVEELFRGGFSTSPTEGSAPESVTLSAYGEGENVVFEIHINGDGLTDGSRGISPSMALKALDRESSRRVVFDALNVGIGNS